MEYEVRDVLELKAIHESGGGKRARFVIGDTNSDISGAFYIKEGIEIPNRVELTLYFGQHTVEEIKSMQEEEVQNEPA